ncbi:hypothetical protein K2X85_15520 [bacterium]|nr:hypothetical protein [bacterium]
MSDVITSMSVRSTDSPVWRAWAGFGVVFLILTVLRSEILFSPPYYDFAVGIWPEAEFLVRTDFDYHQLRFEEPHCLDPDGGPRSYMTSIIPTLLALGMRASPSPTVTLLGYHLFVLACASGSGVLLFQILKRQSTKWVGVSGTLATLTTPLFCVQMDMTSMEMPLVVATLAAARAFQCQAYVASAFLSLLAFFIKPAGLFLTLAGGAALIASLVLARQSKEDLRSRGWGLLAYGWALVIEVAVIDLGGSLGAQVRPSIAWEMLWIWCPDWVILCLITLVVCIIACMQKFAHPQEPPLFARGRESFFYRLFANPFLLFMTLATLAIVVASTRVSLVPRYLAVTVPFLYVLWIAGWQKVHARSTIPILLTVAGFNLVNWNGTFYPELGAGAERVTGAPKPFFAGEGSFLERSHEYLADHQANLDAARVLDLQAGKDAILAPIPFAYFLAYPDFGYISRPLKTYTTNGFKRTAPWIGDYRDFLIDKPNRILVIRCANFYSNARLLIDMPWPRPDDEILYVSPTGHVMVFLTSFAADSSERAQWYERLHHKSTPEAATLYHAYKTGGADNASLAASRILESAPRREELDVIASAFALRVRMGAQNSTLSSLASAAELSRLKPAGARPGTDYAREIDHSLQSNDPLWEAGLTSLRYLDLSSCARYFSQWASDNERE